MENGKVSARSGDVGPGPAVPGRAAAGATEESPAPAELRIDAFYRNTNDWKKPGDEFNRFFRFADRKGINNTSGFRPKSAAGRGTDITQCAFCVLVTTFGESEWPDALDRESGRFTYFGDNRTKGVPLHDTTVGGNRLLRHAYSLVHTHRREGVPPFLCFETLKTPTGTHMRFLGLACPGAEAVSALDKDVAVLIPAGGPIRVNSKQVSPHATRRI